MLLVQNELALSHLVHFVVFRQIKPKSDIKYPKCDNVFYACKFILKKNHSTIHYCGRNCHITTAKALDEKMIKSAINSKNTVSALNILYGINSN